MGVKDISAARALTILASPVTDLRPLEQLLDNYDLSYTVKRDSMASAAARDNFTALKQQHDWHSLPMIFSGEQFLGGEPELRAWLRQQHCKRSSRWLGLAGTLPFLLLTASAWWGSSTAGALMGAYAALIVAFVAGSHWGATLAKLRRPSLHCLLLSCGLALLAWLAMASAHQYSLILLAALLIVLWLIEEFGHLRASWPGHYSRQRRLLTAITVSSLLLVSLVQA